MRRIDAVRCGKATRMAVCGRLHRGKKSAAQEAAFSGEGAYTQKERRGKPPAVRKGFSKKVSAKWCLQILIFDL